MSTKLRKHKRTFYNHRVAVLVPTSFFDGAWIVHPGVYTKPRHGRMATPDRINKAWSIES